MTAPEPGPRVRTVLDDELRRRVLAPYKPHCRYVHRAELSHAGPGTPRPDDPTTWLRLDATCGIDTSCYIDDTGHFNAVEFNITYNQMLYLCLAETTRQRLLPELRGWDVEAFFRHQLPDVLIGDYHAHFHRPMRSHAYRGYMSICGVQPRPQRNLLLLATRAGCSTPDGGACDGEVTIALVNWQPA